MARLQLVILLSHGLRLDRCTRWIYTQLDIKVSLVNMTCVGVQRCTCLYGHMTHATYLNHANYIYRMIGHAFVLFLIGAAMHHHTRNYGVI